MHEVRRLFVLIIENPYLMVMFYIHPYDHSMKIQRLGSLGKFANVYKEEKAAKGEKEVRLMTCYFTPSCFISLTSLLTAPTDTMTASLTTNYFSGQEG